MKKIILALILLMFFSFSVSAQKFYFDIGAGFAINAMDTSEGIFFSGTTVDAFSSYSSFSAIGSDIGIKIGFGPLGNVPIYIVGDFNTNILFNNSEDRNYTANNLGLGVIFYPLPLVQLGASFGVNLLPDFARFFETPPNTFTNDTGFGWNVSAAIDLGKRNHGILIGLKYFGAINSWAQTYKDNISDSMIATEGTLQTTSFTVFTKYAFRRKTDQTATEQVARERQPRQPRQSASQTREQTRLAATGIDGAIRRVSESLINDLPENTSLAVINISSNDGSISAHVADELEFHLVTSRKFTIVDRNTLDLIRSEQNFQMSGDVSDSTAVSIGEMLGARIVITGSITQAGANQRLSIRALDVRTAQILAIAREEF